ncbi:MAG: hypothetical protein HND48_19185 [Chloroflexi bacterium]|nr:hypothetical protein [Chloroflexota bacterium]
MRWRGARWRWPRSPRSLSSKSATPPSTPLRAHVHDLYGVATSTRLLRIASVALIGIGVTSVLTGVTPPLLWPALLLAT